MSESTGVVVAGRLPPCSAPPSSRSFILIVLPATANAACRQAPVADVWYDTPALQVWADGKGFVTCVRATGVEHVYRSTDPEVGLDLERVLDDRWVRLARYTGYESDDSSIECARPRPL